jgi:hypothetical protein
LESHGLQMATSDALPTCIRRTTPEFQQGNTLHSNVSTPHVDGPNKYNAAQALTRASNSNPLPLQYSPLLWVILSDKWAVHR